MRDCFEVDIDADGENEVAGLVTIEVDVTGEFHDADMDGPAESPEIEITDAWIEVVPGVKLSVLANLAEWQLSFIHSEIERRMEI